MLATLKAHTQQGLHTQPKLASHALWGSCLLNATVGMPVSPRTWGFPGGQVPCPQSLAVVWDLAQGKHTGWTEEMND